MSVCTPKDQSTLVASLTLASSVLSACGGAGEATGTGAASNSGIASISNADSSLPPVAAPGGSSPPVIAPKYANYPVANTDEEAVRFLLQSQFAAVASEVSAVRATTFAAYLNEQYAKPMSMAWDWLESRGYGDDATLDQTIYNAAIADYAMWRQLMSGSDPMRQRAALALSEFFVVSSESMEIDWRGYALTAYWDLLSYHAFGNFRDLLESVTLNPAMGYFLNTQGNQKEDNKGRLPDENYAREVMQLFSIGLYELNPDGTDKLDANGKRKETYAAEDVSNLARVFTGYEFDPDYKNALQYPGKNYKVYHREYARRPMKLNAAKHSSLPVTFLGTSIPANTAGAAALKAALDTLFKHPNVGPFFGRQMIQRLVTSNPSPAYVQRVANAFNDNGSGVRGDLRAVWNAVLLDDEARSPANLSDPSFGKLREPIVRLAQWARSFGVTSAAQSWKLTGLSDSSYSLGQSPLRAPSVFNYFRPGYIPPGTAMAANKATAPEFQIVNETTVATYINYMYNVIREGIKTSEPIVSAVTYNNYVVDLAADYSVELGLIDNTLSDATQSTRVAQALVGRLNMLLCSGQLSTNSVSQMVNALAAAMQQFGKKITSGSAENLKRDLVAAAVLMVMASPDYLVQK